MTAAALHTSSLEGRGRGKEEENRDGPSMGHLLLPLLLSSLISEHGLILRNAAC